jgi:hypothetical protein
MRIAPFIISLLVSIAAAPSADHTISSSTVTRGTLTFTPDAIVFKSAKQEEHFPFSSPPSRTAAALTIPGLRVLNFQFREVVPAGGGPAKPASVVTFQSEDGSKLKLAANEQVEVFRIELTFSDDTKVTLWKLAADIR